MTAVKHGEFKDLDQRLFFFSCYMYVDVELAALSETCTLIE